MPPPAPFDRPLGFHRLVAEIARPGDVQHLVIEAGRSAVELTDLPGPLDEIARLAASELAPLRRIALDQTSHEAGPDGEATPRGIALENPRIKLGRRLTGSSTGNRGH